GLDLLSAAWGIHQLVNENMAGAARIHAIERGKDPRSYPVFAFGGAGPVHAFNVARILRSPRLVVPLGAGVTSTVGFLAAPLAFDFVRTYYGRLDRLDWEHVNGLLGAMEAEGRDILTAAGVPAGDINVRRYAEMRYVGQGHEIDVDLPGGRLSADDRPELVGRFEAEYRRLYERGAGDNPVETLSWRVIVSGPRPELPLEQMRGEGDFVTLVPDAQKGERRVYLPEDGRLVGVPVLDRYRLGPGARFAGPAIVEERESTVVIGRNARVSIDEYLNLVVDLG